MENIFIDLNNSVGVTQDGIRIADNENVLSQTDALVGPQGPAGPAGKDGQDGQAATITVGSTTTGAAGTNANVQNVGTSSAAVLAFTIPRGDTGAASTIEVGNTNTLPAGSDATVTNSGSASAAVLNFGIPKGDTGETGAAATITVGSVQTVAPEYPATVTNSGTTGAAILDFEIPQGVKGDTGDTGAAGQAATITVGSTTTGAAGTNASVTNSGTSSAAVLDFTIPRGADGAAGQDGQDGQAATITVGSTTTGAAGTNASVTNSGTSSAAVLNFTIPRGDTGVAGQDGQDGQDGQAATITVGSTTTGSAGTNASVTNSGTSSAAVLNFTIPRGDTGATGPQGPAGPNSISALYVSASALTSDKTLTNSTYTTIQSMTLGAGTWRICWGYRVAGNMANTTDTRYFYSGLRYTSSGNTIVQTALNLTPDKAFGAGRTPVSQSFELTLSSSTSISSFVYPESNTISNNGNVAKDTAFLYAFKVN